MLRSKAKRVKSGGVRVAIPLIAMALTGTAWSVASATGSDASPAANSAATTNAAATNSAAPANDTQTNSGSKDELSEIVVTANRRAERIQDVGAAITAESAEKIEALNMTRAEDLAKLSPGVAAIPNNGSAVSSFSIRGLSQADSSEHEEQPVAIYTDGTYIAVPAATGFPIYDVDHVEILRGPQGTLFGRNATGGLVNFFSNQPSSDFAAGLSYTGGDYNLHRGEGYINGGTDEVSDRFAFYASERDGYIKNLDGPNLLSENVFALRNQTKFNLGENTQATLRLETWQQNGTSVNYQTPSYTPAGSIYDAARPWNAPNLYGYVNPSQSPYIEAVNQPGEIFKRASTAALTVQHEIGDITLFSISSYQKVRINYLEDTDGTPDNSVWYSDGGKGETLAQEFRAAKSTGDFRWTGGVNFFQNRGTYFVSFNEPTFCDPGSTTDCATAGAGSANLPLSNNGKGAGIATEYGINYKSYSGFAQAEYDLTSKLTAILGGRYTYDDQHFDWSFNCAQTLAGACQTIFGTPAGSAGAYNYPAVVNLAQNKGLWSGKAQLNYKLTPDVLTYAIFSKGTKSGGYFDATAGNVPPQNMSFKPETLYATEVGIKSQFLDNRLTVNVDYYHYNYENSQQFNFINGIYFTVVNLPATSNGFELETTYRIMPGLSFNLSGSYNDIWVHDVQPCSTCAPQDERPIDAPKWLGTAGLEKDFAFKDIDFALVYSGRYTGDRYFALINQPVVHGVAYIVQDASLRASLSNGLYFQGWVNNLANRVYATAQFDNTAQGFLLTHYGQPRMVGVTVGMKF
jgi:iron complex outermembrane receptor protein